MSAARFFDALYHVPRSQVWEGSRGGQSGHVHLHVKQSHTFDAGRIHRASGESLCGRKRGWYERPPMDGEEMCPRCVEIAERPNATFAGAAVGETNQ